MIRYVPVPLLLFKAFAEFKAGLRTVPQVLCSGLACQPIITPYVINPDRAEGRS
jgi:hypothetical protein